MCGRAIMYGCVHVCERFKYSRILLIGHKYHTCNFTEYGYDNLYSMHQLIIIGKLYRKKSWFLFWISLFFQLKKIVWTLLMVLLQFKRHPNQNAHTHIYTYSTKAEKFIEIQTPIWSTLDQNRIIVSSFLGGISSYQRTKKCKIIKSPGIEKYKWTYFLLSFCILFKRTRPFKRWKLHYKPTCCKNKIFRLKN